MKNFISQKSSIYPRILSNMKNFSIILKIEEAKYAISTIHKNMKKYRLKAIISPKYGAKQMINIQSAQEALSQYVKYTRLAKNLAGLEGRNIALKRMGLSNDLCNIIEKINYPHLVQYYEKQ